MGLSHYIIGTLSLTSFAVSSLGQTASPTNGIMTVDSVVTHVKKADVMEYDGFNTDNLSANDMSMMMKKETSKSFKKHDNDLRLEREAKEKAEKDKLAKEKAEAEQIEKENAEREQVEREKAEKEELERLETEEQARLEQEQEVEDNSTSDIDTNEGVNQEVTTPVSYGGIEFDDNGLLVESTSGTAEQVISLLLSIPGHSNGAGYHASTGLDGLIDQLSTPEAVHVIHRIEGAGFGQTGGGYAGYDSPESHQAFVNQQVNNRFGGSVHSLLKAWGTFSYGGY